ncbi:MAG: hypothetical protein GX418_05690 [Clostridiales bacterium]|nr:hypothetical protein [Clostridiales bacterium]
MFAKTGDTVTLTATVTGCEGALFQWQWTAIPADVLAGMTVTAAPSGSEEAILVSGEQSAALMWVDEPGATALTYSFVGTEETLNRYWRLMVTLPQGASKDGAQSTPENTVPDNAGNGSQGAEQNVVQAAEEGGTQNAPEGAAQGTEEDAAPGGAAPDGAEAAPAENEKYAAPGLSLAPLGSILCALLVGSAKAESDTVITSEGYASVLRTDTGAGQAETFTSLDKPLPAYVKAADTGLYPSPDESGAPLAALAENECVTVCATGESWAYVSTPTFPEGYLRLDAIRFLADDPAAAPSNSGQSAGALSLSDFGLSAEDTAVPAESAASSLLQVSRMAVSVTSAALPSYLHPQTLVVSEDNESNAHTGTPDGDIDQYLYNYHIITPIEVRFTIATLPARSAHLALYTWDCDETNGDEPEYDAVYVNGHKVGVLTGENNKWNTTLISVPIDYLSLGANYVTVHIGKRNLNTGAIYEDFDYWAIRVKWMQLLLDGGQADSDTETFTVELQDASLTGERIDCRTHVTIVSASARTYEVEYSLVDHTSEASPSYLQIISSDDNTVTGSNLDDYGTLSFSLSAASGEYVVQVLLRDAATQAILATDEAAFDFITGVVPSFDISMLLATQDPYEYTEGPVTLFLSAQVNDEDHQITDVCFFLDGTAVATSLDADNRATGQTEVTANGTYLIELRYQKNGTACNAKLYYTVDNIQPSVFISAQLSPATATAGSTLTVTAKLAGSVHSVTVKDNDGNAGPAVVLTDNGDGTLTYTFTRVESSATTRYWTLTAFDAAGASLGTTYTNTAVIAAVSTPAAATAATGILLPLKCNDKDISSGSAQINTKAPEQAGISLSCTAKASVGHYEIRQNGRMLASSTTGTFLIPNDQFTARQPVMGYLMTTDGKTVSQQLNIVVVSMSVSTLTLSFLNGFDTTFPHNIDLLGSLKLSVPQRKDSSLSGSGSFDGLYTQSVGNEEIKIGIGMEAKQSLQKLIDGLRQWHLDQNNKLNKIDIGVKAMGYIILAFDETGITDVDSDVGVYLSVSAKFTKQVCAWPPLVLDIKVSIEAGESFAYGYSLKTNEWTAPAKHFSGEITIKLQFGVGCKFISAGIYGKVKGKLEGEIIPVSAVHNGLKPTKISLSGEVGLYAKVKFGFLTLTPNITLLRVDHTWPLSGQGFAGDATAGLGSPYDLTAYDRASRDYLTTRSAFGAPPAGTTQAGATRLKNPAVSQTAGYTTLQTSVYDGIAPQIVTAGNRTALAYLDDSGETADGLNYQRLVYSLRDGAGMWSTPRGVDDNGLVDADFRLYASGEDLYAVYSEANRLLTEADLPLATDDDATVLAKFARMVSLMEIVVAKFDPAANAFRRIGQLTSDAYYDYQPDIAVIGGVPTVTWACNLDNDLFGTTNRNTLYRSVYDEARQAWTTGALAEKCTSVTSLALGLLGGQECLAVIVDRDNDLLTVDDRQVRLYRPDGSVQPVETGANDHLLFANLRGESRLVWYAGGGLNALATAGATPEALVSAEMNVAADYQLLTAGENPAVLYTVYDATSDTGGSQLYALYPGRSEAPVQALDVPGYIDAFAAFSQNGAIDVLFRRTDATFANGDLRLKSDLCYTRLSQGSDLRLVSLDAMPNLQTGAVTLLMGVENAGATSVGAVSVLIGGQPAATVSPEGSLAPGAYTLLSVEVTPQPAMLQQAVTVQVLPGDGIDATPENNSASLSLAFVDFAISARQYRDATGNTILATVTNNGTVYGTATLLVRSGDENGELLFSTPVTLDAHSSQTVSVPMRESDVGRYTVEIASATEEYDAADNNVTVTIRKLYNSAR